MSSNRRLLIEALMALRTNRYPSIAFGAAALAAALTTASEAVIWQVDGGADPGGDGQSHKCWLGSRIIALSA